MRQSSHVFQYAQKNPYQVYTEKGGQRFLFMIEAVAKQAIEELFEVFSGHKIVAPAESFNTIVIDSLPVKIGSWGTVIFDDSLTLEQKKMIFSILQENQNLVSEGR